MTFLRSWLLSVTACAVLISIAQQLANDGAMKKIVRFVGGMVLMLAMLRPLLSLSFDLPALDGESYREAVEALKETLSAEQEDALRERIAAQTQAYIEDKAASLGLNVRAEVRTAYMTVYHCRILPRCTAKKTRRSARTSRRSLA